MRDGPFLDVIVTSKNHLRAICCDLNKKSRGMSREITFLVDGRAICIERFEDETDASFAERSSFVLAFADDVERGQASKQISLMHAQKTFNGVTYTDVSEKKVAEFRRLAKANLEASNSKTVM